MSQAESKAASGSPMPGMVFAVGSAAWQGANQYEVGDEFYDRAHRFRENIKWHILAERCTRARGGVACRWAESFAVGHFNMARHLIFDDGQDWIARLRLPELEPAVGQREALDLAQMMRAEVAGMKFLRSKSSIPVPTVHGFDLDESKAVGAPYILMDYVDGSTARDLAEARGCDPDVYGTAEQDARFREQMARIQVELASFTFDRIGTLYQNEQSSEFYIGADVVTAKGPWHSSSAFYADLTEQSLLECVRQGGPKTREDASALLPLLFPAVLSRFDDASQRRGPFGLTNRDFGAHNLLVDGDFQIKAVIDLDGIMAAPIELVSQYPSLTGLDRNPPGRIMTHPNAIKRLERLTPNLSAYQALLTAAEEQRANEGRAVLPMAHRMLSAGPIVVQGLLDYGCHQVSLNQAWMTAYARLVHDRTRALLAEEERAACERLDA